jgi:NADPH:quinone reductase
MMKAVILNDFGTSDVLTLSEVARPKPSADQLLVRVKATALNRADILQRQGFYPPPPGESDILGLELAGEVVELGSEVNEFSVGERVFGLVGGGGYAEYAVIDQKMAMPIPQGWEFTQAAATPEAFFTANETVFELGELKPEESVLIHAGGSGVGTAAIQMAQHIGANVYFTAGSTEKINKAMALGATAGIDYKNEDFLRQIKRLTKNKGVDVIEDFLGAKYLERNLRLLKASGRLIIVALMGGKQCDINLDMVLLKRLQIKGFIMRSRSLSEKREMTSRFKQRWLPILEQGAITPVIDSVYPLDSVKQAHEKMEANQNFGKIVLTL